MKRFVDVRGQYLTGNFCWYDTISDTFEYHDEECLFDNWEDFLECYKGDDLERYKRLCPDWVFNHEPNND